MADALVLYSGRGRVATVVDATGTPVAEANSLRLGHPVAYAGHVDRAAVPAVAHLEGNFLFGGTYWNHFGHFLFESTARLWGYPALKDHLDGIVFVTPRGLGAHHADAGFQRAVFDLLGVTAPVIILDQSTAITTLQVPAPGCGLGALASGTPEFRAFVQSRFRRITPRAGAAKIYLSRSGFGLRRGGMLAEAHLEAALAADGYLIYQPEKDPLEAQIATYLGAEKIISPDSSALHAFGFAGSAAQQVAIVLRRPEGAADIAPQITAFTGRAPLVLNCITRMRYRSNARTAAWAQVAEVDFSALGKALWEAGFLSSETALAGLSWREIRRTWALSAKTLGGEFCDALPSRRARQAVLAGKGALPED